MSPCPLYFGGRYVSIGANIIKKTPLFENAGENIMWKKPAYKKIRLGFEVTMYVSAR